MKLGLFFAFLTSLAFAVPGWQYQPLAATDAPKLKGIPFRDFLFSDFFDESTKGVVVVFLGTKCPLVKQSLPTLKALQAKYERQGVRFLAIYPNRGDSSFDVALHALATPVPFRALFDVEGRLARLMSATVLTEAAVFNSEMKIIYQGAIDDQFLVSARKEAPRENYLAQALENLLAKQPVKLAQTQASGCEIEFPLATPLPRYTFYKHVLPIIQNRCQSCHRPGEIGDVFGSFLTYDDVYNSANTIREAVVDRRMPPYYTYVNPKFGKHSAENQLTAAEVRVIDQWVKNGAEEGDVKDAPAAKVWPRETWLIGKPDQVITMPEPFRVPSTGKIDYQFFRLPLNFPEDRWVQAVELKPGNKSVVHHMQLHLVPSGNDKFIGTEAMTKLYGIDGEKAALFHSFVPGDIEENARTYSPNQAMRIPKKTDFILELHYTPSGQVADDQSSVGLRYASQAPKVEICAHAFKTKRSAVKIPAFAENVSASRPIRFRKDIYLHNLRAHMHELGRSFLFEWVHRPGPELYRETFVAFPIFDFGWQRSVQFAEPVFIPAGQEIQMTGYWDNSRFNPNNSDPSRTRTWGLHTTDEMMTTGIKFSIADNANQESCMQAVP